MIAIGRRRKKTKKMEADEKTSETASVSTQVKPKKKRSRKKKALDLDKLADSLKDTISDFLGLNILGIPEELIKKIVREILDIVITSSSYKPSTDTILKRINRHLDIVRMIIAARMLEHMKDFTNEQLEFIVYYGGKMIIPELPRLYKILVKKKLFDLLDYLKYVWEKYGQPSPVKCPKCGFYSVMPDSTCFICGYTVTDEYLREELGFEEKFREYIKNASVAELQEIIDIGFVLVDKNNIYNPKYRPRKPGYYFPIYLRKRDILLISEEISRRKIKI